MPAFYLDLFEIRTLEKAFSEKYQQKRWKIDR
jgi:hypothetical protein